MKKLISALFIYTLIFISAPLISAQDLNEPQAVIKNATQAVIDLLKDSALEKNIRREKIMEVINPLFDFTLMSKLTLGKEHWPKLNEAQKKEFTDLFVDILKSVYLEKAENFSNQVIEYGTPELVKKKVYVTAFILQNDEKYKMVYKMHNNKAPQWLVYDLEIQDISIIKSYQSQFDSFLQTGTVEGLLKKMKEKFKTESEKK